MGWAATCRLAMNSVCELPTRTRQKNAKHHSSRRKRTQLHREHYGRKGGGAAENTGSNLLDTAHVCARLCLSLLIMVSPFILLFLTTPGLVVRGAKRASQHRRRSQNKSQTSARTSTRGSGVELVRTVVSRGCVSRAHRFDQAGARRWAHGSRL